MSTFVLWVDGDSCPFEVRRIIERASRGRRVRTVVVADRILPVVEHQFLDRIVVEPGPGATDRYITDFSNLMTCKPLILGRPGHTTPSQRRPAG